MSGHPGINKTSDRLLQNFCFPGITAEITRYCKSCDICQRTVEKGRVPKVPLGHMPIIDTPFDRVAIDLIGPIEPISERGHRYILTVVDYATRYPEAVALKNITTETVAEALVEIYSRVGIPKEVLSDQGTQFVSGIMKEVSRILSVKQLVSRPYHPMCNGLCEKFNGTLKTMLKKVCAEKPKDWDRYIAAILFAYRGVKQESLGFTPFELLYGRTVRGPMNILRELWTKKELEPEVKTTYEYVIDLQNRLKETCELAQIELKKAQEKQRKYYNLKSVKREFEPGSKVLIMRPNNNNKLLMQWQGPFVVLERVRGNDYQIDLNGQNRMYHANMLKQYFERNTTTDEEPVDNEDVENELDFENAGAAILEVEDTEEIELPVMEKGQTENYKNVDVNLELDEDQKKEV
jgi:transposase InsO family protein